MPVDEKGTASFAWESIENTTTEDVEVVGVTVDDDTVEVAEWFLTVEDWRQAGVSRGTLARPGPAGLPTTLAPGGRALVAMSVCADDVTEARRLRPTVEFEGAGGRGELELEWVVEIVPADQSCG